MTSAVDLSSDVSSRPEQAREAGPLPLALGPVSRTLLIPLWARAAEMKKRRPLVNDPRAVDICQRVDFDFGVFRWSYGTQIGCVLRGLLFDEWASSFLARHPGGTVVELGAGLSTRFERIDDGKARWVDVDLPDAIALRRRLFNPTSRRTFLGVSVLDPDWPAAVKRAAPGPYTFVSEGMLMYLASDDVRALLRRVAEAFGPCEIAMDSISPAVVRHQRHHDSMKHMMDAPFRWGIDDVREVESWDSRFVVRDVATLPDIAARYHDRVALSHRVAGAVLERALPAFASAYRLSRIEMSAHSAPR